MFDILTKIQNELEENFPYKVLKIDGAEADDIIAILSNKISSTPNLYEEILIISGDKDFIQLHQSDNVKQYSPTLKKFVVDDNPEQYKFEHIIRGDKGDGVPNILSSDDTFITEGKRQRPITTKKVELWNKDRSSWTEEMHRNFHRNETMVDLSKTPESIRINIINQYTQQTPKRGRLMEYFVEKRLKNLMEHIEEFE